MRGYKRTPKKRYHPALFQTVTENGKVTKLTANLDLLARLEGYKSVEEFMLQSDFLDRFNELKKRYSSVRIYQVPTAKTLP